jgi:hypothetical protein
MDTTIQISTEDFLKDLFGSDEAIIYFNVNKKTWHKKPQTYSIAQPKLISFNKNERYDIYFIPNSGGTKIVDIININALFIDWDAGRDTNKQYYPIDIVLQKKQDFLQKLSQFPYKPTYIIETRNGYHVYWFLFPGCTTEEFRSIQKSLIHHFKSDPAIHNPNRVMKLPGYDACKNGEYEPFLVSIVEHNDVRYSHSDFSDLLPTTPEEPETPDKKTEKSSHGGLGTHNNNITELSCIIVGPKTPRTEKSVFSNIEEVVDYLKQQDLSGYLNEQP